jgi:DNA-binding GntR family transcriptional regulator
MIDPDGPTPVYVQIAHAIAERIARGDLAPNRPIPSETQIQQEYGVARATARHAVAELRKRGLVYTVPQRGTYVSETRKR